MCHICVLFNCRQCLSNVQTSEDNLLHVNKDVHNGQIDSTTHSDSIEQSSSSSDHKYCTLSKQKMESTQELVTKKSSLEDTQNNVDGKCLVRNDVEYNLKAPDHQSDHSSKLMRQSLRLQLEKVRLLRDQYETGFKCTEAIERLSKLTKSRNCDRERRANERLLVSIEQQLEDLIGTFRIRVEDIEGWARICPQDNYEIEFRHGKQRQLLRVRIGKSFERTWERNKRDVVFQGSLKPTIVCRIREMKSRWNVWSRRNVTLGVTSISMNELLTSASSNRPILLDANASGTLKIRITCTWQPNLSQLPLTLTDSELSYDLADKDISLSDYHSSMYSLSLNRTPKLSFSPVALAKSGSAFDQNKQMDREFRSKSESRAFNYGINKNLARSLLAFPSLYHENSIDSSIGNSSNSINSRASSPSNNSRKSDCDQQCTISSSPYQSVLPSHLSGLLKDSVESTLYRNSNKRIDLQNTIKRLLCDLECSLEDYRGQYVELAMMSIAVNQLIDYFEKSLSSNEDSFYSSKRKHANSKSQKETLVNSIKSRQCIINDIENALAEFDFLHCDHDCEDDDDNEDVHLEHTNNDDSSYVQSFHVNSSKQSCSKNENSDGEFFSHHDTVMEHSNLDSVQPGNQTRHYLKVCIYCWCGIVFSFQLPT